MSAQPVYPDELDRALAQRWVRLDRLNLRMGRCCVWGCALPIPPGKGRHVWINGQHRGLLCLIHEKAVMQTAHDGKEEL